MRITDALEVRPGDVVALVGAGGKTSTMFRLADELVQQGWRVVTTTTTRVAQDELSFAPQQVGFGHGMYLPKSLPEQLSLHRHVFVFTKTEPDHKVRGVRPAWLDENLAQAPFLDVVIVEADGSRRLPMKAPLPHEPVIPSSASIVVPVISMEALGQPLDEAHIYGAEIVHRLTGHPLGEAVTSKTIAAVLIHPQLGVKGIPPGARIAPLLNRVTAETLSAAREVASYSLTDLNINRVLLGCVHSRDPVLETRRRIGAIILAAGESRRMGQPKMLLPWKGTSIIRRVCEQVIEAGVYEAVVVVGRWRDAIQMEVDDLPVRVIVNPDYEQGEMLSSLQAGIRAIWHTSDACMVVLGDQPAIQSTIARQLVECYFQGRGMIVAPSYQQRRGHPLIIDRIFWQSILDLPPGAVPRDLIRANEDQIYHLVVESDSVLRDIDTPDEYRRYLDESE